MGEGKAADPIAVPAELAHASELRLQIVVTDEQSNAVVQASQRQHQAVSPAPRL